MSMTDLPIVAALRDRMQWSQARQKVLAENVVNANTPGFRPRELVQRPADPAGGSAGLGIARTSPLHLQLSSAGGTGDVREAARFETRPSGNAVSLEDEMIKVADNQAEYQLAATLYQKSLALLRTAAGGRES